MLVLSDNITAVAAINRQVSNSFEVNNIIGGLRQRHPKLQLRAEHIEGRTNPADAGSRNAAMEAKDAQRFAEILAAHNNAPVIGLEVPLRNERNVEVRSTHPTEDIRTVNSNGMTPNTSSAPLVIVDQNKSTTCQHRSVAEISGLQLVVVN